MIADDDGPGEEKVFVSSKFTSPIEMKRQVWNRLIKNSLGKQMGLMEAPLPLVMLMLLIQMNCNKAMVLRANLLLYHR